MPTPLVSVVIPAYNSVQYIGDCLRSVVNQTYGNIEVVVVDDGSEDDTSERVRAFEEPVVLIRQKNGGVSRARNAGIAKSSGAFVAFLDSDDVLEPKSVEERVSYLQSHRDIGWVFTDAMEFKNSVDLKLFLNQFPWLDMHEDIFTQLLKKCFPLTSTVMLRSDLLKRVSGFKEELRYAEDLELYMRLSLLSSCGLIRQPLTRRRLHDDQAVNSYFDRWFWRMGIFRDFQTRTHSWTLSDRQQQALRMAYCHACYKLAEHYWSKFDLASARKHFRHSRGPYPWNRRAQAYIAMTHFPINMLRLLRRLRGNWRVSARRGN